MIALPTTNLQTPAAIPAALEDELLQAIISGQFPTSPAPHRLFQDSGPRTQDSASLLSHPTSDIPHPTSPTRLPTGSSSLAALAAHHHISLRLLLDFLAAPTTRARIAAAVAASDLALHQRTQAARHKALDALEHLLDTTEDPIEKRRAATALLRGPARNPPTSAWSARVFPTQDEQEAPALREPPVRPNHDFTPEEVVQTCVERLQDNDNPTPNAGLETLFNFKFADKADYYQKSHLPEYLDDPDSDDLLVGASSVMLHPPEPTKPEPPDHPDHYINPENRHIQRITLSFPDLTTHQATFHLKRTRHPESNAQSWIINRIEHHFDDDEDIDNDEDRDDQDNDSEDTS